MMHQEGDEEAEYGQLAQSHHKHKLLTALSIIKEMSVASDGTPLALLRKSEMSPK